MSAGMATETGGWTALQAILDGPAAPEPGSGPTSPGARPSMPRRRHTDRDNGPTADPTHGRWWPARPTCDKAIVDPRHPLEQLRCVLPPHDVGTCLPNPRRAR